MGRTKAAVRAAAAEESDEDMNPSTKKAGGAGGKRETRERASKSYREEESDQSDTPKYKDDDYFDADEVSDEDSGSDWNAGNSSGSEYGKKKSKKKGAAVGRGRKGASPRGRGRPAAKKGGSSRNGSSRRKRGRDDSEEESEPESSGSEYGKKKKSPKKSGGRGRAAAKKPTPAPSRVGSRQTKKTSYRELSEDEDELSEEEVVKKPAPKRAKRTVPVPVSDDEGRMSDGEAEANGSGAEEVAEGSSKKDTKVVEKNGSEAKKQTDKPKPKPKDMDDDYEDEDDDIGDVDDDDDEDFEPSDKKASGDEPKEAKRSKKDEDGSGEEKTGLKNRTDTDYKSLKFSTDKKSPKGESSGLKISSWNIGGIKSWISKNGLDYLEHEEPDVMCLQEIRCSESTRPAEVKSIEGYPHTYWSYAEQAGHHGVALLCKKEPIKVTYGFPVEGDDDEKITKKKFNQEGRLITAEYEKYFVVNAYVPNSGRPVKDEAHPKGYPPKVSNGERQEFDGFFRDFVIQLGETKPVIITGDLNVSHEEIDIANPKTNTNSAGFTQEERDGMTELLDQADLIDAFRELYPDQKGAYSYWSYMHNARSKNIGWRLDYFLLSKGLRDKLCETLMRTEVFGSDHCPIVLFMDTTIAL